MSRLTDRPFVPPVEKIVVYYRVSDDKQERSGLGLAAQERTVANYLDRLDHRILGTFTETETATKRQTKNRPELQKALALCQATGARLVIAKLDRLIRNVPFLVDLRQRAIRFKALDIPDADETTLYFMSTFAQHEAARIKQRTRDALAEFKAEKRIPPRLLRQYPDGVPAELVERFAGKLGAEPGQDLIPDEKRQLGAQRGQETLAARRAEHAEGVRAHFESMVDRKLKLDEMVTELTAAGVETPAQFVDRKKGRESRACAWSHASIRNVLARLGLARHDCRADGGFAGDQPQPKRRAKTEPTN